MEESGPIGFLLNINDIHEEGLEQGSKTTGDHDITGTPDTLVEWEAVGKQIASDNKDGTYNEKGDDLIRDRLILANESAAIEAEQHMGNGGNSAQQALRIDRTLMIKMVVAEEVEVDLRQDIDAGILGIAIAKDQDGSINHKEADDDRNGILVVAEQGKERHNAIADSNALHDGPDAQMAKAQEIALDGIIEPVDEKTDDKQEYRTLDNTTNDLGRGFELRFHQREVTGDTHDEKEEGEDKVARSHAVPLSMLEHFE